VTEIVEVTVADLIEVAVMVTVVAVVTEAGAVYKTLVVVLLLSEPTPVSAQETPSPESLAVVAVIVTV